MESDSPDYVYVVGYVEDDEYYGVVDSYESEEDAELSADVRQ